MVYRAMKRIIERKTETQAAIIKKLNMFYANNQLTDDEYAELMELVNPQE